MVDGVVLVVDATEGPMTQTRFVLQKALSQHIIHPHLRPLKPIVVINKADRPTARIAEVEEEVLELFINLNANEQQLDYKTLYASAKDGWAVESADDVVRIMEGKSKGDMKSVLDLILNEVPPPSFDRNLPFSMLVTQLESDAYVGKCYLGRISSGVIKVGDRMRALNSDGAVSGEGKVVKLFTRNGLERVSVDEAGAGDIISIAGLSSATVNSTLCADGHSSPLPVL
jgi:GTP-binding protein